MNTVPVPQLTLTLPQRMTAGFASLLQHGMLCSVDQPVALLPFLLLLPGFNSSYIEKTVQTIFINGISVDNFDRNLQAGSIVALSAAMPGLAGAIFRRQGLHGFLRSQIEASVESGQSVSGFIILKLFNSIATDRVEDLLTAGILVTGKAFCDFAVKREYLFQAPVVLSFAEQTLAYAELLRTVAEFPVLAVKMHLLPEC